MDKQILTAPAKRLFVLSSLILFFELVCIRWIASYVLYLGYFRNFVLLGALLGIGAGALMSRKDTRLFRWVPLLVLAFFNLLVVVKAQVVPEFEDFVFFTSTKMSFQLPPEILLPLIFLGVAVIFTFLSQELGSLLNKFQPLKAYNINILGSLAGIAGFTLLSFLSSPAWVWFLAAMIMVVVLLPRDWVFYPNLLLAFLVVTIIWTSDTQIANVWSPYNRLNILSLEEDQNILIHPGQEQEGDFFVVFANGVQHQTLNDKEEVRPFYEFPYTIFPEVVTYKDVLVIGAGGGNDIAFALEFGAESIDAVDIDPKLVDFGRNYHPANPYQDPRVHVIIDDGRAFLENTDKQYDLIIFALPDSLTLATNATNLRLESYLFTVEAFQSVKARLKPGGMFTLYNMFRYDWLVSKLGMMLEDVFGTPPVYSHVDQTFDERLSYTTIFAGPKTSEMDTSSERFFEVDSEDLKPATDDWPFLYLKDNTLPGFYTLTLGVILLLSFVFIQRITPKGAIQQHGLPFFFMGAAFTLLEVKSIVQFLLLFGATWIVNSLVFFGILLVVLVANALAARYDFKRMDVLYGLLFLSLVLNFFIPIKSFLGGSELVRFFAATLFLFSPIFFANLIYSTTFKNTAKADVSFGANLLGTMVGGAVEYLSLAMGYRNLVVIAAVFYLLAFIYFTQWQKRAALAAG